ncbi:MAG: SDR family NAD(P)-dependent oxidoreductase [bacterium]
MNLAGSKALVTGAAGFIGSHLVERLVADGCRVRCFVRYTSRSDRGWLAELPPETQKSIKIVAGDLKDSDAVRGAVRGCEVVFHLGALIGIPYSYIHPRNYVDTNIVGSTNVLCACRDFDVERLVHVSTSEVYGSAQYVPIDEKHPKVGQSPYSASKIAADMLAESFHRSFELPVTIIRPFNTFGPRQSLRAVIPTIVTQLLKDGKVKLGATSPTRDLTYVEDTVAGLIRGAEVDGAVGRAINLGSGQEIAIGELAAKLAEFVGVELELEQDRQRLRPAESEVTRLLADNSRAREILGWQPKKTLEAGLAETVAWYRKRLTEYPADEYVT